MADIVKMRRLYFVCGIKTNFGTLMQSAIRSATHYGYDPWILDIGELVIEWKKHPNDWKALGVADRTVKVVDRAHYSSILKNNITRNDTVIFLYLPDRNIRYMWFAMQRRGAKVGAIAAGPVPDRKVLNRSTMRGSGIHRTFMWCKRQLKPRPDFWITAGSVCNELYRSYFRSLRGVPEIPAHSIDYEKYRLYCEGTQKPSGCTPYSVVLDQGWFTKPRPDFLDASQYPPATLESFVPAMNRFLSKYQEAVGHPVKVACHPKADLKSTRKMYPDFEVLKGDSLPLVAQADTVLANSTTALQYAVLFHKPVLLFTSDELDTSIVMPLFEGYKEALNAPVVNVDRADELYEWRNGVGRDNEAYDRFIENYIKVSSSPALPLWEIVFEKLRERGVRCAA